LGRDNYFFFCFRKKKKIVDEFLEKEITNEKRKVIKESQVKKTHTCVEKKEGGRE
jgi:hypothetical protein